MIENGDRYALERTPQRIPYLPGHQRKALDVIDLHGRIRRHLVLEVFPKEPGGCGTGAPVTKTVALAPAVPPVPLAVRV